MGEMESLKELVARVLEIDKKEIKDSTSPENVSSWDSFTGPLLASELERNFKVKFTMDEVMSVKNFKDIKNILKRHGIKKRIDD